MVHPGGRPRTTSFSPDEMITLGEEMVEWVKLNDPLHLSEWYTIHKMFTYKQWKSFIKRKEFIPYYEKALKIVGRKYIDKNSNVRDGISHRWQRIYFNDIREDEDEILDKKLEKELIKDKKKLDYEYSLKQKSNSFSIPTLDSIVEKDNRIMELQALLDKKNKELESVKGQSVCY